MQKKLLLNTELCCVAITTFAMTHDMHHTTTFTSNKKPLVVSQNEIFDIKLQSNPSTGFSWKLTSYQKPLVKFIGHKYVAPKNTKLMGAPGYETFTFQAKKGDYRVAQVGHIVMMYARPWTKDGETKKTSESTNVTNKDPYP